MSAGFSVTKFAPIVNTVNPSTGVQGATMTAIVITGTNFTGATAVSFGGGTDITGFTVNGDTQITANIVIANGAAVGSRFVTVVNQSGRGTDPTGFNVTKNESIVTPTSTTTTTPPKSTTTPTTTTTTTSPQHQPPLRLLPHRRPRLLPHQHPRLPVQHPRTKIQILIGSRKPLKSRGFLVFMASNI